MKYLIGFKLFENTLVYGQKDGFINQNILDDVKDILLEDGEDDLMLERLIKIRGFLWT